MMGQLAVALSSAYIARYIQIYKKKKKCKNFNIKVPI